MRKVIWSVLVLITVAGLGGCDDPCGDLERRLCDALKDKERCALVREPDRRSLLSDDACKSMLKAVKR